MIQTLDKRNTYWNKSIMAILEKGGPHSFQKDIEPMLATLVTEPIDEKGWLYEMKWDGYTAMSYINNNGTVNICSRNNKSFNKKYYPLHEDLKKWNINAVVDGEIVGKGINLIKTLKKIDTVFGTTKMLHPLQRIN